MRIGRGTFGLKYAYFDNYSTPLLDKVTKQPGGNAVELGGTAAADVLDKLGSASFSMHATCYEGGTKVKGLKAASAWWNPRYYNTQKLTLTKPLLFISPEQLLEEVRALAFLALSSGRSLIIPNILGSEALTEEGMLYNTSTSRALSSDGSVPAQTPSYMQRMWPGFRVAYVKDQVHYNIHLLITPL